MTFWLRISSGIKSRSSDLKEHSEDKQRSW